jgi:anhydro-N-acetylmuramic acid kinase
MPSSDLYVGLISGTSVDGVDCALVQFNKDQPTLLCSHFKPSPDSLRQTVLQICSGEKLDLSTLGQIDIQVGRFFAEGVNELLEESGTKPKNVTAIGSHGQTFWHQPAGLYPFSMQLGDPNSIAFHTGITTVADFRRMDIVAGGQGAPLAPLLHRNVFQSKESARAVANIGGISNLTCLPVTGDSAAFDSGPGNVLMDYWIGKHEQRRFDENGQWAASGNVNAGLLDKLLDESYFALKHPKSTGRELFSGDWLENKLSLLPEIAPADVQATLLALTAKTIAADLTKVMAAEALYVCGGGAHNTALMDALRNELPDTDVASTAALGIHPDWVEAIAFAWMARERMEGRAIDTKEFTGAKEPVMLGGVYTPR